MRSPLGKKIYAVNSRIVKTMEKSFLNWLQSRNFPGQNPGILLAVSGGPDSVAMLHLFQKAFPHFPCRLEVAHMHHGIRGQEADEDARFVKEQCRLLNIPFSIFQFDVPKFANDKKLSLEEAARRIRYHFLRRCAQAGKMDYIALGHTADDQAETILMNLMRGAGPRGLRGIAQARLSLIRPLLHFTRMEILQFLQLHRIPYQTDSSNHDLKILRNWVRLEMLPYFQERFGDSVKNNILRTAKILEEEEQWFEEFITPLFQKRFVRLNDDTVELMMESQNDLPIPVQRRLLRKFIETTMGHLTGISFQHIEQIRTLLDKQNGKRFEFPPLVVERTSRGLAMASRGAGR